MAGGAAAIGSLTGCAASPARPARVALSPAPAQAVVRDLSGSGLPVRVSVVYTPESDPDGLLGRPGGYLSKLAFVDPRVDGGEVADSDPGSVALGGVVEVFPDQTQARSRALRLQQAAAGIPTQAEYDFVSGRALVRVSAYLNRRMAEQYLAVLHAVDVRATPTPAASRPPYRV